MATPLSEQLAWICRQRRIDLDVTQGELARALGVSRGYLANVEVGRANPSLAVVSRLGDALGLEISLVTAAAAIAPLDVRDALHARCSSAAQRHLRTMGFECLREVAILIGRRPGWIDLLAFDARRGLLLIIEIKTRLQDIGEVERQLGWYERHASGLARERGWNVRVVQSWLLVLGTEEVEQAIHQHRAALRTAFPLRARTMQATLAGDVAGAATGRGLAVFDPASRRKAWLTPTRVDGRRSPAPYRDYADAARRLGRRR